MLYLADALCIFPAVLFSLLGLQLVWSFEKLVRSLEVRDIAVSREIPEMVPIVVSASRLGRLGETAKTVVREQRYAK